MTNGSFLSVLNQHIEQITGVLAIFTAILILAVVVLGCHLQAERRNHRADTEKGTERREDHDSRSQSDLQRMLDDFASMSHELRTPMNAIIGLTYLALRREQSDENRDSLSKINSSAQNLLSIINAILDFSKTEGGTFSIMEEECNEGQRNKEECSEGQYNEGQCNDEDEGQADFGGAKILICEDNEINQEIAKGVLESFHAVTAIAQNGQEGIDLLEKEAFDIVLMDISMPVMDGHEATVRIRESGKPYSGIPIIAMTANVMQDEVAKCMAEGMNDYIGKPIDIVTFQRIVSRYLPKR